MDISARRIEVVLDNHEAWSIGCHIIGDITSDYNLHHWKSLNKSFHDYLKHHQETIRMARRFCVFCNESWVDQKLSDFEKKLDKSKE